MASNPRVQIELGDTKPSYTTRAIEEISKQVEAQEQDVSVLRENINWFMENQEEGYWGKDGYNYDLPVDNEYNLPAGLYSFDAPLENAEKITEWIYFGAGRIVVSNEKRPDGTWKTKSILDGNGLGTGTVSANNILANSIGVEHLKSDVLTTKNIRIGEENPKTLDEKIADLDASDQANYQRIKSETEETLNDYETAILNKAETEANAYADNVLTEAERRAIQEARERLEQAKAYADSNQQRLETELLDLIGEVDIRTHIKTDPYTGDLLIGKPGSGVQMRLTNDRLSIEMEGEEVAFFGNKQLYITEAVVVRRFLMGDNWEIKVADDGNLNITWIGEDR